VTKDGKTDDSERIRQASPINLIRQVTICKNLERRALRTNLKVRGIIKLQGSTNNSFLLMKETVSDGLSVTDTGTVVRIPNSHMRQLILQYPRQHRTCQLGVPRTSPCPR